ncbi:MAG: cell wall-active antibiotics response protein, partial [Prevotellaceae bacterium]|nr:cell wall-active antibiotics response protein [Prevotellaceae bacterium]
GIELDLRKAYLPEGDTLLNIEAIFGGISLFVPDNWLLDVQVESILGGIDDSRRITDVIDTSRRLIIKGSVVFGGVEIRN